MNYERIYNELISSRRDNIPEGYIERHHIIPKCLGGSNDSLNIVALTAREHYIAHKLLCKMYPDNDKLYYAVFAMSNMKYENRDYRVCSSEYERLSKIHSENVSKLFKGIKQTKEHIKKRVESFKGYKHSDEIKKKISNIHKGKIISEKQRKEHSEKIRGRKQTKEHIRKRFENRVHPQNGMIPWNRKVVYESREYIAKDLKDKLEITYKELTRMVNDGYIQTK